MKTVCQVIIAVYALVQTLSLIAKDLREKTDTDTVIGLWLTVAVMSVFWSVLYFAGSFSKLIGE